MSWDSVRRLRWMVAGFGLVAGTFLLMVGRS